QALCLFKSSCGGNRMGGGVGYRPVVDIPGYFVGSNGSVWSLRIRGKGKGLLSSECRLLSIYRRPYGARYCVVRLRAERGGKVVCRYVHRLVLEAFVGPCPPGYVACHHDGNTANNRLPNLRWDTQSANMADQARHGRRLRGEASPRARFTEEEVRA